MKKKNAVLCDLDGTLALFEGRRKWYEFDKVFVDLPRKSASLILINYNGNRPWSGDIIIITGRPESCRRQTEKWLEKHLIPYTEIIFRRQNDDRPDYLVKYEIYKKEIEPRYDVDFVLDDRNSVVQMWRDIGLECWQPAITSY